MPELPEVETVRRTLKNFIIGKKITSIDVRYPNIIEDDPEVFVKAVTGQTINDIDRLGKFLVFKLDDIAFVSHLRMEGKYQIIKNNEPIGKHDHIIFHLDDGSQLRYNDTRKFGRMKLVDLEHYKENKPLDKLGPEPKDIDEEVLYQTLKKIKKPIKQVLLDQTIIAGLGNIYANEVCFDIHINPHTPACNLSKKRVHELKESCVKILDKAIEEGGTTIHSFSANGIDGLFQVSLKAHMKKTCTVCGGEITKDKISGRGTYYCKTCQKARR